ncbi:hypothetical protein CTI12_AA379300 [Artemisia annua]|uniref:Uncharacterized protein n=1 Tax=Artemisia annua TaxID=35608 RepID=A0A2U1MHF4_ARTAN|nr:hypothetical protein CTI12_AA379300 [Artemisia annua]
MAMLQGKQYVKEINQVESWLSFDQGASVLHNKQMHQCELANDEIHKFSRIDKHCAIYHFPLRLLIKLLSQREASQDAHTGKKVQNMVPTHSTVQVIYLPFCDSTEQQLHLLIDADNHAHLYPKTPEAA